MPHKRSEEGKKRVAAQRRETKCLELLEKALPALGNVLHTIYSNRGEFQWIAFYILTKKGGLVNSTMRLQSGQIFPITKPHKATCIDTHSLCCHVRYEGREIRLQIPFGTLERGIDLDKSVIEAWVHGQYTRQPPNKKSEELRDVVYTWILDTNGAELCRRRSARIKEELVAAVWHPRRVARRLEEGGWDAIDAIL